MDPAEKQFKGMLKAADLPVKPSYRPCEVCLLLDISLRTFWRLTERFEKDPETGEPATPDCLDSYLLRRERRVRYDELLSFLERNNTYERRNARA